MLPKCIGGTIAVIILLVIISVWHYMRKKASKKGVPILIIMIFAIVAMFTVFSWVGYRSYLDAARYEEAGNYAMALERYEEAHEWAGYIWTDIEECINRVYSPAKYAEATALFKQHEYTKALVLFLELGNYGNSKTCVENCMRAYLESQ